MAMVMTGAKAVIKLNGSILAFATGVSIEHDVSLEPIPNMDTLEVCEWAENGLKVTMTMNFIKLSPGASLNGTQLSNSASTFSLDDQSDLRRILLQPELIIEVLDNTTDTPVYVGYGGKFAGGSGSIDARGVWMGTWRFNCRSGSGI